MANGVTSNLKRRASDAFEMEAGLFIDGKISHDNHGHMSLPEGKIAGPSDQVPFFQARSNTITDFSLPSLPLQSNETKRVFLSLLREQQQSGGPTQIIESETITFQPTIQSNSNIVDNSGFGHDSSGRVLEEKTIGTVVVKETGQDPNSGSNDHRVLEPTQSPMIKTPSPEDIFTNVIDPITDLQVSAGRNTSEKKASQLTALLENNPLVKQEQEHLHGNHDELSTPKTPDNEMLPKCLILAEKSNFSQINFPTELHKMINRLPPHYRLHPQMKYNFEAMIENNTAEDEPLAPKISIIGRKDGPVTPPWEFYYTNGIIHGKGVPKSDRKSLQGCECLGPCNPKSETCACVRRQTTWTDGRIKGFLYKKGKLIHPDYPVFECNNTCDCSEECSNRVVQKGRKHRISILFTGDKGWGVFAEEKIPRDTYLGTYSGELILEAEANERGKLYDRYGQTYLFDIDFYHLQSLNKEVNENKDEERTSYTMDAFRLGNFTRFLNHSCTPNCRITATYVNEPDVRKPALTIFTLRRIEEGEEITIAYPGERRDEDKEELKEEMGAGPSPHIQKAIYSKCFCGAANCRGKMF